MPYITQDARDDLNFKLWGNHPRNTGELNYLLTEVLVLYLKENGLKYQTCNDIVGALENCKAEFQRRVQSPYEDRKIRSNGDVYPKEFL